MSNKNFYIDTKIDPGTNLPDSENNPFFIDTSKDPPPTNPLFFDTFDFTDIYTDPLDKYTKYGVGTTRIGDWNEERAGLQTTGEKWRRGLAKGLITTAGAIAENTLGVLFGIPTALFTDKPYYENAVGRNVDKMNNWAREQMPNYYTQRERDMNAWQRLGTANFWADKAMNGLGYSFGSIATMALTGGAGYIGMAGRAMGASRIGTLSDKAAKIHKLYKVSKDAQRGEKLANMMGQVSRAQRFKRAGQMADAAILMSLAESSVEARETRKHTFDSLVQLEMENQGVENMTDLGTQKLDQIRRDSNAAGNANFGLNMGILSLSNAYMFGKLLGPRYLPGKDAIKGIRKTGQDEWVDTTTKGWRKAWKKTKPIASTSLVEGMQEGSQYASNIMTTEFANAKYSDQGGMTRFEAMSEGLSRTFGETDGVESILLGIVTGGIMGGGTSLVQKPVKNRDARAEAALRILNSGVLNDAVERGQGNERTLYYIKKMEEAREKGNEELFEQYRTQAILSDVISVDNAGLMDLYYEKLDDAVSLSDQEFAKQFGYNEDAKFDKHKVVGDLKKDLKLMVKRKNALDAMFPITQTRGVPRLLMSEEERVAEDKNNKETLMLRDHLLQNSVFLDKVSDRKRDIAKRIAEVFPGATLSNLEKFADQAKEKYDTLIEAAILEAQKTDPSITSEAGLSDKVKNAAYTEALASFVGNMGKTIDDTRKINPADKAKLASGFANYYGLHSHQQDLFEDWNRLETTQGRGNWLRAALIDQENMTTAEANAAVEDLIQQETNPENIAKNTPKNASRKLKNKAQKEAQNIQNIIKNINDRYMDPAVTLKEVEEAINARAYAEEAQKNGFKSTNEKQDYIELLQLRNIKKQREANAQQEEENRALQESAEREKNILFTALFVNDINKLKKVYKPVHPNEHYNHIILMKKNLFSKNYIDNFPIGKQKKIKIVGRYKSDRMDVLILEEGRLSQYKNPFIVLSLADNVSMEEVHPALYEAGKSTKIKMYKSPRYVNTTFGYMNGNNRPVTSLEEEQAPTEQVESPAAAEDIAANEVSENETNAEIKEDTQLTLPLTTELETETTTEEAPMEKSTGETNSKLVEEGEYIVFEDEFVDPEVLAAELEAQNAERRMMEEGAQQELTSIPTQEELLKLEAEEKALLEEEKKLRKDLGKEDDNCAT